MSFRASARKEKQIKYSDHASRYFRKPLFHNEDLSSSVAKWSFHLEDGSAAGTAAFSQACSGDVDN
jgi:hypothetical protein